MKAEMERLDLLMTPWKARPAHCVFDAVGFTLQYELS